MATGSTKTSSAVPDERGRFGEFGRRYVPETLMYALDQLTAAWQDAKNDPEFDRQFKELLRVSLRLLTLVLWWLIAGLLDLTLMVMSLA